MTAHVAEVSACSVGTCSFNHDGCTAFAITVSGSPEHASCATFIDTSSLGGLPKVLAHVGACQRAECKFNDHLMCDAHDVRIGPGSEQADCLTYQPVVR
ncbi:DUF1540 domain-containing protein [Pseudarthrobacter sp. J75]|uniref:DUF1540 domain-containing protein n=1 Tax=unclassified Pseudarthrobacter TaxID=2647000 RepID=UPI002E81488B|nr:MULTISPECIES: DUF1540 domain-containing protein [unclassified Pseudarthrobacter]MEE2522584.1 DUF1540 domain-containing protein [Pseudarthrobacter sp. J47]MEE2529071.1 DUF1540 domain-containing protein [Pseudarthrobacter sp. J75]MEE2570820.1 DUF1540 domain-containing protein [Pseudarthrobacter sp. J64]